MRLESMGNQTDHEKLDRASHILNTFGVPLTSSWKMIYDLAVSNKDQGVPMDMMPSNVVRYTRLT